MLDGTTAFSGFSVDDIGKAKTFYGNTLGLKVTENAMGLLELLVGGGKPIIIYPKGNGHSPASFTILNFLVKDIDVTVGKLTAAGVAFEHYDMPNLKTDAQGVARGAASGHGPDIAWFKDPAGNILSLIEE